MNIGSKVLYTVPALLQIFFMLTIVFPVAFDWLHADMHTYNTYLIAYSLFQLSIAGLLIRRVWQYKTVESKRKWNWTWLLVFMGNVAVLFYVWGQDKVFLKDNSTSTSEPIQENGEESEN